MARWCRHQLTDPNEKLAALFAAVERVSTSAECLGCPFQAIAAEFPDRNNAGHQVALAHKNAVRRRFADLARQARLRDPDELADQLLLLMDGAWVAARMFGAQSHAGSLASAAAALIEDHRRPRSEHRTA